MRVVAIALLLTATDAFLIPRVISSVARRSAPVARALDYNDPVVGEEFMKVQATEIEDVEEELGMAGIKAPPTMNEMDIRLMLVEVRLRASGRMPGESTEKKAKKTSFANDFERALYEHPGFEKLYKECSEAFDTNRMNIMAEYMVDPVSTKKSYSKSYEEFLMQIETALKTKVEKTVASPKVSWSGFPSNVGEAGIEMTLKALGELVDFSAEMSDDGMTMEGTATFSDVETAKKCLDQYDGMDMGLGTTIEITPT